MEDGDGSSETQNGSENNLGTAESNDTDVTEESAPGVEYEATANGKRTKNKDGKTKGQQSSESEANSEEDGAAKKLEEQKKKLKALKKKELEKKGYVTGKREAPASA